MPVAQDLTGRVFGRWTVIRLEPDRDEHKKRHWLVECICGERRHVRTASLLRGDSKSCGCLARERRSAVAAARLGDLHPNWRGESAGYRTQHAWVSRRKAKRQLCDECGTTNVPTEWANISGEYRRDLNDYRELCLSCHRRLDRQGAIRALMAEAFEAGRVGGQSFEVWIEGRP